MIVVTYVGGPSGSRDINVDGVDVSSFAGPVQSTPKTSAFNIGYSTVFTNRDFNGMIGNVAVWDRALTAQEVTDIYAARNDVSTSTPEPGTLALLSTGLAAAAWVRRARRSA
jgi:hypothetical protein